MYEVTVPSTVYVVTVGVAGTVVAEHLLSEQWVTVITLVDSNVSVTSPVGTVLTPEETGTVPVGVPETIEDDPLGASTTLKRAELTKVPSTDFKDSAKSEASSLLITSTCSNILLLIAAVELEAWVFST